MLTASQLLRQSCEELCQFFITHFDWISINLLYQCMHTSMASPAQMMIQECQGARVDDTPTGVAIQKGGCIMSTATSHVVHVVLVVKSGSQVP